MSYELRGVVDNLTGFAPHATRDGHTGWAFSVSMQGNGSTCTRAGPFDDNEDGNGRT
jgi:hypothetical protein